MLPTDAVLLLATVSALLVAARYLDAWWFFRSNALRLRQLASVPWPMRSRLAKPSYFAVTRSIIITIKLLFLLLMAPIAVCTAMVMQPDWVTATDKIVSALSIMILLSFAVLDRRILALLRERYNVPNNWRSLLR